MTEEVNKKRSVNFIMLSGRVVIPSKMRKYKKKNISKTRLRIKQGNSDNYAYVDLVGFEDIALKMNLVCQIGNIVLVYAHLFNAIRTNKKGEIEGKVNFLVDGIELVSKSETKLTKQELEESTLKLIDELNPEEYL